MSSRWLCGDITGGDRLDEAIDLGGRNQVGGKLDAEPLADPIGDNLLLPLLALLDVEDRGRVAADCVTDVLGDQALEILAHQDAVTDAVDQLSLLIHHPVVFEEVLPDLEVALLDLLLRTLDLFLLNLDSHCNSIVKQSRITSDCSLSRRH